MKQINSKTLLEQLQAETRQFILTVNYLYQEDPGILLQQPAGGKWSVVQVIEHLNIYGRYYLPAIEKKLNNSADSGKKTYKPGLLGNYFTNSMLPKEEQVANKMKTPKGYRPPVETDSKQVLDEFIAQEKWLLDLLEISKHKDLGELRIPISLTKLVRLKLGDTFRFLVAHHQRHFIQVKRTLEAVKPMAGSYTPA